jgi:DNA replication initiation complex subunit (GINS family)
MSEVGVVRLDDTNAWLTANGWHQESEGRGGWMWFNVELDRKVGVVRNLDTDEQAGDGLVSRLADAHGREVPDVRRELQYWGIDVTYVRAANDVLIADTIPLNAGAAMTESARLMFRSAASAALRLRPVIKGGYSKLGDAVADSVRMGHTIKGSYIIPVEVRVGDAEPAEDAESDKALDQEPLSGWEAATTVESLERRMTRTFAQAMAAVHEEIVQREKLPQGEALLRLVSQGVTAEFVDAVARVLDHSAVAQLDTTFQWALAQPAPRDVRKTVAIPSAAKEKMRRTGVELRSGRLPRTEVFTGPVVRVSHEPEERTTGFAIRTVRGGRLCRIEAVTTIPVAEVTQWMRDGTTIQLQGTVQRGSGGLYIPKANVAALVHLSNQIDRGGPAFAK